MNDRKIKLYTVVSEPSVRFKEIAKDLISRGYIPLGSIAACQYGRGTILSQAFVTYKGKKDE